MEKLRIVGLLFLSLILFNCNGSQGSGNEVNEDDKLLMDGLGFDIEILSSVRSYMDVPFEKVVPDPDYFDDSTAVDKYPILGTQGLLFKADEEKARDIVKKLHKELREKGYLIFISKSNFGFQPDEVTIIKSKDQFDILRFEGTNGANYDITMEAIIDKLKEWDKLYGILITGADMDWVEANFVKLPPDMNAFSKEIYDFCPDVVDQGTGSVEELTEEMKMHQSFYLWWD